jgi:hypothetical protein
MTEVQSPAEAKDFFSSFRVQTGSGAHPSSYEMGTGDSLLGVKCSWGMTQTTHPHLVQRSRMSRSCISFPPHHLQGGSRTALLYMCWSVSMFLLHMLIWTCSNMYLDIFFPFSVISHFQSMSLTDG